MLTEPTTEPKSACDHDAWLASAQSMLDIGREMGRNKAELRKSGARLEAAQQDLDKTEARIVTICRQLATTRKCIAILQAHIRNTGARR